MPSSLKKKSQSKESSRGAVSEDDILEQMLLDVPKVDTPVKKILTREPENRPFKKARVATPPPVDLSEEKPPIDDAIIDGDIILKPIDEADFEERDYTRFYWYDSYEDQSNHPGAVYFFGRVLSERTKRYVSCCTKVENIQRTCYLLINQGCTYEDAKQEFACIFAPRYKLKSFECRKVAKKYAFSADSSIPLIADYVQVDYLADQSTLPSNISGQTFSHAFNTSQTPMEKIILDLKLRGPCWMKLVEPKLVKSQMTWTTVEYVIDDPKNFSIDEESANGNPPYFCALSLSLRTYSNPTTHQNEIIAIAAMVNADFHLDQCLKKTNKASGHFLIMTKPTPNHKDLRLPFDFHTASKKYTKTRFELVDTERDLLVKFLEKFIFYDPDIVIGHDLLNYDYETLVARMKALKVGVWSKLGRFKRNDPPSTKAAFRYTFSGRVMCDIRTSAMELIHSRSYDMTELTSKILQKKRVEYSHEAIIEAYKSSDGLIRLLNATWDDNDSIFSILVELNVIPLALKITNITGNILSRTLAAGRSERNEYLLLHAFHEDNFICPEKRVFKSNKRNYQPDAEQELAPIRRKAAYAGGLVLEPKAGYYDSCILLMDFNSLYPSIIREYNICFSTVKVPGKLGEDESSEMIAEIPNESAHDGVLPNQLKNLVERRQKVKRMLVESKSADQKIMLDIEQKALKLTANSMYGCLGFEYSRFYAKHLASLVTFKGREILMSTKAMVERLGYDVIYGDTDSLMIDTKIVEFDEVIQRGETIKGQINRTFKLLEIDIDGVYRPLLLLKKKNYAGTTIKKLPDGQFLKSVETKGLDTVRRDRAVIAKEAGERVLSMILESGKEIHDTVEDIHNYLKELGDKIRAEEVPIEKFLISKQLNRNPNEYRDHKGLGHVTLALRYNNNPNNARKMKAGDTVEFVICLDGSSESANQRAYTLEEMKLNAELKLDHDYYLCQQIHPVMTRICDKLPITNAYVLAEMLGIEKSGLLHIKKEESNDTSSKREQLLSKGDSRFNSCQPLKILCPNCNLENEISTRLKKNKDKKLEFSLSSCTQCNFRLAIKTRSVVSQVIAHIKKLTLELFATRYVCENSDCEYRTRNLFCRLTSDDQSSALSETKEQPICDLCEGVLLAEMDDRKMDLQLNFLKHLFNLQAEMIHNRDLPQPTEDIIDLYYQCHREVDYALRCSFINNVDVHSVFSMICKGDNEQSDKLVAMA